MKRDRLSRDRICRMPGEPFCYEERFAKMGCHSFSRIPTVMRIVPIQSCVIALLIIAGLATSSTAQGQRFLGMANECAQMAQPDRVIVDEGGIPTHLFFGTAVNFDLGPYPIERVHLELVRERLDGQLDTALFHYAGHWQMHYRDTTAQAWAHILAPKDIWSDDAAIGEIRSGCFWGQAQLDAETKSLKVHGVIRRVGKGPIVGEWNHLTQIERATLRRPSAPLKGGTFALVPDLENRQFLLQGRLPRASAVSIYLTDANEKLVGVVDTGRRSGRYRRVLNFGNRTTLGYALHIRVGDAEQIIQIP